LIGGVGAFVIGMWINNADVALRTPNAIKRAFDLPTLAVIPLIRVKPGEEKLISHADAIYAEPYRALAIGLGLSESAPGWTVGITSSASDEGKSLTTANLGIALAEAGRRTLIIDADLRTPMQHRLFKVSNRDGLTGLLHEFSLRADAQGDEEALTDLRSGVRRADVANLSLLTSGPLPPYPDEVLSSAYLPRLLRAVAGQYDVILIDAPPTQAANAIRGLSACLDSALLVIDAQRTRRRAARKAVQLLQQADARLAGAALNRARLRDTDANAARNLIQL
jgi:capsular exopolysaccharide synthesis family protein